MKDYDWSRFEQKIPINAPVQIIYYAWTMRDRLEQWFLRKAEFHTAEKQLRNIGTPVQQGDTYEWLWHGQPDSSVEKGRVISANGTDEIQFSFAGGALVTVHIEAGPESIVTLTQEQIPTDENGKVNYNLGCQIGWAFYLTNLKSILEGGIDLRNKNVKMKGVINS